jgi:MFS family permease
MSIPGTVLAVAINALLAEAVPPELRGQVVGRRNAIMALSQTTTAILCGQLLDRIIFPLNYQIVFGIGAAGALMSSYFIGRVRLKDGFHSKRIWQPMGELVRAGMPRFLGGRSYPLGLRFLIRPGNRLPGDNPPKASQPLLRLDLLSGPFGKFLLTYLFFYTFQYVPLPLFPLFYVHELHLTDGTISLGSALFYSLTTLTSLWLASTVSRLSSYRQQLVYGAILFGQYPLLIGLAQNAFLYLVACGSGGIVWGLLNAGLINRLMERVPAEDRPAHMTLHNLVLNLGILGGSLAGPVLAGMVGLREAILISVALRLLGGVSLAIWA